MGELDVLKSAVVDMREDDALEITRKLLAEGVDPLAIFGSYREALTEIGRRFECNEYFIPELIMSGEIMSAAADLIKPHMGSGNGQTTAYSGTMVLATVQGDIHDIGKNIAGMILELNGIRVVDLGVDVPSADIVAAVKREEAQLVGLSGLLTLAFDPMKEVVDLLTNQGLRAKVKVIIGGGQMDEQVTRYVGADGFATDAITGLNLCKSWLSA